MPQPGRSRRPCKVLAERERERKRERECLFEWSKKETSAHFRRCEGERISDPTSADSSRLPTASRDGPKKDARHKEEEVNDGQRKD